MIPTIPNPSKRHHFVPELVLSPWLMKSRADHDELTGVWWDDRSGTLKLKCKGVRAFCFQIDLLTLHYHRRGPDALERYFEEIDTKGALVKDAILNSKLGSLDAMQRCDFARLLLSLDARRPVNVQKLRSGETYMKNSLNNDPAILEAMKHFNIQGVPSEIYEDKSGIAIADRALSIVTRLVDNETVGLQLINASWHLFEFGKFDGKLVVADRPLVRTLGYDHPLSVWLLPLTPTRLFVAANSRSELMRLRQISPSRLLKDVNRLSAGQAERFVFSTDPTTDTAWLEKRLRAG